jgi:hypothetical protein
MKPPDMDSVGTVGKPRAWYVRNISKMLQFGEMRGVNMFINQRTTRSRLSDSDPIFFSALMAFDPFFSAGRGARLPCRAPAPFPNPENPREAANA